MGLSCPSPPTLYQWLSLAEPKGYYCQQKIIFFSMPLIFKSAAALITNNSQGKHQQPQSRNVLQEQQLLLTTKLSHDPIFFMLLFSCSVASLYHLHGLQPARLLCPWNFPRQEYWSELLFPSPGNLPDPRIEPMSPALAGRFSTAEPPGKNILYMNQQQVRFYGT